MGRAALRGFARNLGRGLRLPRKALGTRHYIHMKHKDTKARSHKERQIGRAQKKENEKKNKEYRRRHTMSTRDWSSDVVLYRSFPVASAGPELPRGLLE